MPDEPTGNQAAPAPEVPGLEPVQGGGQPVTNANDFKGGLTGQVPSVAPAADTQQPSGNPLAPVVDPNQQQQQPAQQQPDPNQQLVDSSGIAKKYLPDAPKDVLDAVKPVTDAYKHLQSSSTRQIQELQATVQQLQQQVQGGNQQQQPVGQPPATPQVPDPLAAIDYSKVQTDPTMLDVKPQDFAQQVTQTVLSTLDQRQQMELAQQKAETFVKQSTEMETARARQILHKAAIEVGNKEAVERYGRQDYVPTEYELNRVMPKLREEADYIMKNIRPVDTVQVTVDTPQGPMVKTYELYPNNAFEMADQMLNSQHYAQQNYQNGVNNAVEQMQTVNDPVIAEPGGSVQAPTATPANLETREGARSYADSLSDEELNAALIQSGAPPLQRR